MERAATIEDVMAIIDRMSQEIKAMAQETDKQIKETDKQIKETDKQIKETNRQIKETNKKIGELGGRLGEIVEYISSPHLEKKFKRFGIVLDTFIIGHILEEPGKGIIAEVDIFLSNGEYVVAVEAKSKPKIEDIDNHVERMKKLRAYANRHNDPRKYIGAIAGLVVSEAVKGYAFKQGFPVLVPSGESIELECPSGFVPKEW
ncbi:MAG: hypothetical protein LBP88_08375 [Treponema sp.]|jgi:uncharacterized coiled-coil DUF342 family protein|nr:hypothetical protein [Treponema sp.]